MWILRTLYLHGILLPWDLFIAKRSALKRASRWLLKWMIILSSSWDISNLVSGTWWSPTNLLITQWILISLRCFWYHLKGLLKGFQWPFRLSKSVKYFQSYGLNEVCDSSDNWNFWDYVMIFTIFSLVCPDIII